MEETRILSVKNVYNTLNKIGTVGTNVALPTNADMLPATEQHVSDILQLSLTTTERADYQICYKNVESLINFSKQSRYQRLEYIESNNGQFIDTEFKPSNATSYVLDMQLVKQNTGDNHFFSMNGSKTYITLRLSSDGKSFLVRWGASDLTTLPHTGNIKNRHVIVCDKGTFQCDDASPITIDASPFTQPQTIALFAFTNNEGRRSSYSAIKVYSLRIYENGELIRDMVPCYDSVTDTRGLYDFVRKQFTKNGGTGSFATGPQIGHIISPK